MSPSDPTATDVTGGLPYTLTPKGRTMSVVQSSQWLPISVPPGVIVPVLVVVVYPAAHVAVGVGLGVPVGVGPPVLPSARMSQLPTRPASSIGKAPLRSLILAV